jgi:RNA polymerase sigma factor (TIGR02999 family)
MDVLEELRRDDRRDSLDRLVPAVYQELRVIARRHLAARGKGGTLSTTGVVHEAYLKLVDQSRANWTDRAHFLALASTAMRHILIDRARALVALKRGGSARRSVTLDEGTIFVDEQVDVLLQVDEALQRLAELSPRLAKVVECRFFGGMSEEEIASSLDVTVRTVERDWSKARMLLRRELGA